MSSYKQTEFDLRLSREDFHAKTSQMPANKQVSMETAVVSGKRCFGSSEMYGQRGQLLKMYQPFDLKGLPWSFKISARSGMSVNGIAFPLVQLTRLTREIASGLLPTVTQDSKSDRHKRYDQGGMPLTLYVRLWPTPTTRDRTSQSELRQGGLNLGDAVRRWPTPTVGDSRNSARHTTTTGNSHPGTTLTDAVRIWPTPRASRRGATVTGVTDEAIIRQKSGQRRGMDLETAVRRWPTPRASNPGSRPNGKGGKVLSEEGLRKRGENIEASKDTSESSSEERPRGSLNPTWVEWLMGFPTGWTDLSS